MIIYINIYTYFIFQVETRTVISPLDANDNPPEFSVANIDGYSFFVFEVKQA